MDEDTGLNPADVNAFGSSILSATVHRVQGDNSGSDSDEVGSIPTGGAFRAWVRCVMDASLSMRNETGSIPVRLVAGGCWSNSSWTVLEQRVRILPRLLC